MTTKRIFLSLFFAIASVAVAASQEIERAEPLCWWVGMKTPLQILFKGENIGDCSVRVLEKGISVKAVHRADSPNYLFADIDIPANAKPGIYTFEFSGGGKKFLYRYALNSRKTNSADRQSFSSADLVYLLMPDRFANGNPANDSTDGTLEKADRSNLHGRHGGDIQGIANRLEYLQELGVTALWCTPLLLDEEPANTYHGYACADYYRIDPRYGTNEEYRDLVHQAHEHGIKMIMDVVTNHCGLAHYWLRDAPFADWINRFDTFTVTNHAMASFGDPNGSQYDRDLCARGWFSRSMPDMNLKNPFVLRYFTQWAIWWVEWADLDGLRVDTYPYNDQAAMSQWCQSVTTEYPGLNIVGECWFSSPPHIAYWQGDNRNRDGFDSHLPSVMDFALQSAIAEALQKDSIRRGEGVAKIHHSLTQDLLYNDPRSLLIFLDNHDTERFADLMKGDPAKVKLGLTLLATLRGVPQLYYGTELLFASADLKQGHGGARIDFPGGWTGDAIDLFTPADRTSAQQEVFEHARKLFNWRKTMPVIHDGKTLHFLPADNCYVYFRYDDNRTVMVIVNAAKQEKPVEWGRYAEITKNLTAGQDIISGERVSLEKPFVVAARSSAVIVFDTPKK